MSARRVFRYVIAYVAAVMSAGAAARYGFKTGDNVLDAIAGAAIFAVLAVIAVHGFSWSVLLWRQRSKGAAFALGVCAIVTFSATVIGGMVAIATRSADRDAVSTSAAGTRGDLEAEQRLKKASRDALGTPRPIGAITADLNTARTQRAYVTSLECGDVTIEASRVFCSGLRRIEAELAGAKEAARLDDRLAAIAAKLADARPSKAENAQRAFLGAVLRLPPMDAEAVYSGLAAFGLELGALCSMLAAELIADAGGAPRLVRGRFRQRRRRLSSIAAPAPAHCSNIVSAMPVPPVARIAAPVVHQAPASIPSADSPVVLYLAERIEPGDPSDKVRLRELHAGFPAWCRSRGLAGLSAEPFEAEAHRIANAIGITVELGKRSSYLCGARLVTATGSRARAG